MSELKTKPGDSDVDAFIAGIANDERRQDCLALLDLMSDVTGEPAKIWGGGIVGFGSYHYRYASGREGDWFLTGFAPRKNDLTLYIMAGFDRYEKLMAKLGKHRTGKSCLYLRRLSDVDVDVLRELTTESVEHTRRTND